MLERERNRNSRLALLAEADLDGGRASAMRVCDQLSATEVHTDSGQRVRVTVSAGVAEYDSERDADVQDVIRRADEALYRAKEAGRNRVYTAV